MRAERLAAGLQDAFLHKGWKGGSTKQSPRHTAEPDLVHHDFTTPAPNRLWVADLTRIMTGTVPGMALSRIRWWRWVMLAEQDSVA